MGLPEIIIEFKSKAVTAMKRSALGIVTLILRDTTNKVLTSNVQVYKSIEDIKPGDWSEKNIDYIKKTLLGTPSKIIAIRMTNDESDTLPNILKLAGSRRFNYLAMPEATAQEAEDIASWIKSKRTKERKTFKAVLPNQAADSAGVINFTTGDIQVGERTYTTAEYTPRIAGILAGLPFTQSSTYFVLPEVDSITETETPNEDIDDGQLILINDGEKIKIGRGVNSLVTITSDMKQDYKKIKITEIMDMIHDDIYSTFENFYVGKVSNIYDNQVLFITSVGAYFKGLAGAEILDPKAQNFAEVDVEAQRLAWESIGTDTTDWNDQKVKEMSFGSNVFLGGGAKPVDAMEDLKFKIAM